MVGIGFIYLWKDIKHNRFYLGSHYGSPDDGYVGSGSRHFQNAYAKRPETFRRRILQLFESIQKKDLQTKEREWLQLIKREELQSKYYNVKRVASGGDIYSDLTEEQKEEFKRKCSVASRKQWNMITQEDLEYRKINAFGGNKFDRSYMKQRNRDLFGKRAKVFDKSGNEFIIEHISEFCEEHGINYGNFKAMLRGSRQTCGGFTGNYI